MESLNNNDSGMTHVLVFLRKLVLALSPPPKAMPRDRTPDAL
jgi:hypothetical protein